MTCIDNFIGVKSLTVLGDFKNYINRAKNQNSKLYKQLRNYVNIIEKRVYGRSEIFFVTLL